VGHLGVGVRHAGSDDGTMRFSGRPASNVADKYLDTGDIVADYATMLSLEAVWSFKPFTLMAEHVQGWVNAPESGNPTFSGSYLTASWVVTGESRPYLRTAGYSGGIMPTRRFGAVELVGRYGYVDLADGLIDGGVLDHWYLGVNWWTSAQWKIGVSYGNADLNRDDLRGNTHMLLCRMQWMY
jgi:phosphate-selective porin OprO and OprP